MSDTTRTYFARQARRVYDMGRAMMALAKDPSDKAACLSRPTAHITACCALPAWRHCWTEATPTVHFLSAPAPTSITNLPSETVVQTAAT
jgi:hypothetical protein